MERKSKPRHSSTVEPEAPSLTRILPIEQLRHKHLDWPIWVFNVDGTPNTKGTIEECTHADLVIDGEWLPIRLMLSGLGKQRVILGLPWLRDENLRINWKAGTVWLHEEYPINELEVEEEDHSLIILFIQGEFTKKAEEIWDIAALTKSTILAAQENTKKETRTWKKWYQDYHKYLDVFSEKEATRFPQSHPWDHKIDLKPTFQPKSSKIYPLSQEEEKLVQIFLDENLSKGYIRHSESPMASPLFFVAKKDGKECPCQDYRYLNEHTIKNTYPLPLISDLMDKLKGKKYFSKFNIRWGYNNIWICNRDQWIIHPRHSKAWWITYLWYKLEKDG